MVHRHKHHDATDVELVVRRSVGERSSDMNVTPLIDVLLVLLVIFMATLPLAQRGVDINLPLEVNRVEVPKQDLGQVVVEYTADKRLTINKAVATWQDLQPRLRDLLEARTDKSMFIIADRSVPYGEIMIIIDAGIGAGGRVAMVTDDMRAEAGGRKGG